MSKDFVIIFANSLTKYQILGLNSFTLRTLKILPDEVLELIAANEKFWYQSESYFDLAFSSRKPLFTLWMMELHCHVS